MFILAMLLETTNKNLLLGFMPESLGLFLFGALLIAFAASLRWLFNRNDEATEESFSDNRQSVSKELKKQVKLAR